MIASVPKKKGWVHNWQIRLKPKNIIGRDI